jgi:monoterpene epsilon-lactone hydrolase
MRFLLRKYFKPLSAESDVHKVRAGFEANAKKLGPAKGVLIRQENIAGVDCEWLIPPGCESAPLIYYLHGGAYMVGSPRTHRKMVGHIAKHAGMRALLPDYRLAPENPFPAALEDSTAVYRSLLEGGNNASRIAIGGDSAGGNLSMATLLALRDARDELPAACFLLSPWLDLACEGETLVTNATREPWFAAEEMPGIVSNYCSEFDIRNPLVSPVFADVSGLPPTLIQAGDQEILLSDSLRLADNISASNGSVTLQIWPDMWHVFQYFIGRMPESKRAIQDVADFLRKTIVATD